MADRQALSVAHTPIRHPGPLSGLRPPPAPPIRGRHPAKLLDKVPIKC
jgi:hypothetical protein